MAMLTESWLPRVSPPPTWQEIAEAVEFVGYPDIAQKLRDKFCECHTYSFSLGCKLSGLPHCISQADSNLLPLEVVAETHDRSRTSLSCLNNFKPFVALLNCRFVCS